jgi:hypothetical protein
MEDVNILNKMFQGQAQYYKDLFEGTGLKWWIKAAGVGAVVEAVHVAWLAILWIHARL